MREQLRLAVVVVSVGCAAREAPPPSQDPVARSLAAAAAEAGVPADLLTAIAIEERGIRLPALRVVHGDDPVPSAGALELRHGRLDTLALGARLLGTTEDALRADTDLGTRAGAHVVAYLGAQTGAGADLASWRPALEALSGMDDRNAYDYASRVFAILRGGGAFGARDGETIRLATHADISPAETVEAIERLGSPEALGATDFPGAIAIPTSCTNKCTIGRPLGAASVNKIVIHDTETDWDGSVATLQNDGGKSVHYLVDADGSRVGQFRPETDTTWHAGNYYYNETSIGIEHVGVASDPKGYSAELYAKSRALVQNIRTRWTVPLDRTHIIGHYQIPDGTRVAEDHAPCTDTLDNCENSADFGGANNHRDPGYYWQWCQYMQKLGGACTCNDAWPNFNCTTDLTQAVRCQNGVVEIADCDLGCEVKPIGTPDVCNQSGAGSGSGSDGSGSDGTGSDGTGSGDDPPKHGGCAAGTGSGWPSLGLVLAGLLRRRRRKN